MDKIIFEIKNQIFETVVQVQVFFKNLNVFTVLAGLALLYFIFMRQWELKKILSFFITNILIFLVYVRIETGLVSALGQENSAFVTSVGRIIFLTIFIITLVYHAAIKE